MPTSFSVYKAHLISFNVLVMGALVDFIVSTVAAYTYANTGNLTAGLFGSLLARFFFPRMSAWRWVGGLITGIVSACLFGGVVHKIGWMTNLESWQAWGITATFSDAILQLLTQVFLLLRNVFTYAAENPLKASDTLITQVDKGATVWAKIAAALPAGAGEFVGKLGEFFQRPKN